MNEIVTSLVRSSVAAKEKRAALVRVIESIKFPGLTLFQIGRFDSRPANLEVDTFVVIQAQLTLNFSIDGRYSHQQCIATHLDTLR